MNQMAYTAEGNITHWTFQRCPRTTQVPALLEKWGLNHRWKVQCSKLVQDRRCEWRLSTNHWFTAPRKYWFENQIEGQTFKPRKRSLTDINDPAWMKFSTSATILYEETVCAMGKIYCENRASRFISNSYKYLWRKIYHFRGWHSTMPPAQPSIKPLISIVMC